MLKPVPDSLMNAIAPWLERHRRDGYLPVIEGSPERLGEPGFGGFPLLPKGHPWPLCGGCKAPMPLLLQLDVKSLPEGAERKLPGDILQLFYCDSCDGSWSPFAKSHLTRLVPAEAHAEEMEMNVLRYPSRAIVGWRRIDDYPDIQELMQLGLDVTYDFAGKRLKVTCAPADVATDWIPMADFEVEQLCKGRECSGADKWLGWPNWIQNVEYPACPRCETLMEHVFQVTGDPIEVMFGDMGIGHITQCPTHRDVLTFAWACH